MLLQLKELLEGPYRTLEAFRADAKTTVRLSAALPSAFQLHSMLF